MKGTEYSAKIDELMTIKERKKLLREIQESKKKLFYENPHAIFPFIREKISDSITRDAYPRIRHKSPDIQEYTPNIAAYNSENDNSKQYLSVLHDHRSLIEGELAALRIAEERNRKDLEQHLTQLIQSHQTSNNAIVAEIREMLRSFNKTQLDLQRDSPTLNPIARDLKILRTKYLLDGGNDSYLLNEIDSAIKDAEKTEIEPLYHTQDWPRRRKDLASVQEKSYKLRDLERQNAELERQLEMSQARKGFRSERNYSRLDENNMDHEKMQLLQKQIEDLKMQIVNIQQPPKPESFFNRIARPTSTVETKEIIGGIVTRNIIIFIDSISGIGQYIRTVGVTLSLYDGSSMIGKPLVVESVSVTADNTIDKDSFAKINLRRPVMNCPISFNIFALLELKVSTDSGYTPQLAGWAKLSLINDNGELRLGNWKETIREVPIRITAPIDEIKNLPHYHDAIVNYRVEYYSSDEVSVNIEQPTNDNSKPNTLLVKNGIENFEADNDGAESDVTVDLDERPEFGFQIIRVGNMTIGDGVKLAKVRMTVYHSAGAKQGQIVMSKEGPITCSTSAVRSDFKMSCYDFGRQTAKFTNADLSVDCLVYGRFYFQGDTTLNGVTDEILVAWTAIPVIRRRTGARMNPSYVTDSLKLLKINRGLHNVPLYEPPALPPHMVSFDQKKRIKGQKIIGRSKLKFRLFHTTLINESEPSSDCTSPDEDGPTQKEAMNPWISRERTEPVLTPYHQSEGFDLYIDSGRLLPDSVTIIKIEGSIVDRHLINQGPIFSAISALSSDIYNPIFSHCNEVRQPHLTPSSTLLLKILTFDREDKNLVVLGYSALKLFIETGTDRQPNFDNLAVLISLNEGGHQLRIFVTEPTINNGPFTESWFIKNKIQPIPGASLLVRMLKPSKNSDGRSQNTNHMSANHTPRPAVIVPAPEYQSGYYYSMNCKPREGENKIMMKHLQRNKVLLRDLILSKWAERLMEAVAMRELIGNNHVFKLFDMFNKDSFNFDHIAHYDPTHGFKISVDGALNLPWSGYALGHICIYPPGALYMKKPLMAYDRPSFVSKLDLHSTQSCPIWVDNWKSYRRRKYDRNLVAIIHFHEMKMSLVKCQYTLTLENQAWTPLCIFNGPYCVTKSVQMPLISGAPTLAMLQEMSSKPLSQFLLDNIQSKTIALLPYSSVIIRQCDSRRHLEVAISAEDNLLTLDQSYLPQANLDAYRSIVQSNNDVQFNSTIPAEFTVDTFQTFLKEKFKSLIYKLYEQDGFFLT